MNYPDSVRYLYSLGNELKVGAKWDLDRMRALLLRLGNPERRFRSVHIAGTNGKGSTATLVAAALQAAGYQTGLFTSPHLVSPTERIRINGQPVSEEAFAQAFNALPEHLTYFETVTAMAFWTFAQAQCDWAVIEVGLGGRLDATNVITPELSVITPISFDHESFLGHTLAAIAGEKAGIIKPGIPVVVGHQPAEALQVIQARAGSPVLLVDQLPVTDASFTADSFVFAAAGESFRVNLAGRHQLENAQTALLACRTLGLATEAIQRGFAQAQWPGRLERIQARPDIILDGAHNPAGARALAAYIREFYAGRPVWLVYGTMRDKAIGELTEILFPLADRLILTAPDMPRALRPQAIAEMTGCQATLTSSVAEALALACQAPPEAAVFITGSLFVVGEAKALTIKSC